MSDSQSALIDWGDAEIEHGTLTVHLMGELPRGWGKRFQGVLALLDHGDDGWGEVALQKKRIKVSDVREGSEGDLRHLLESVLLQVNSDLDRGSSEGRESEESHDDPQDAADRRMTDRFRAFGEPDSAA